MRIGRVTGSEIAKNKDGDLPVRLLQVEISGPEDLQTVELCLQAGETCNPPIDSNVCILEAGKSWLFAIAIDDGIEPNPDIAKGEREIYGSENGIRTSNAIFRKNGDVELNGNDDFAVRFSKLKNAFDQLKDDYNEHTHTGVTAGKDPTAITTIPSTADISDAKIENIKVSKENA